MLCRVHAGVVLVACALVQAVPASVAQSTNPPSQSEKKPAAEKFPFPGESGAPAKRSTPAPSGAQQPAVPPSASAAPAASTDKKFPFPGASGSTAGSSSSSDASSSSSSSAGDSDPADAASSPDAGGTPELKDKGSEGQLPGRHILHRVNPQGTKLQSPDERAAEDVHVARFYIDSGDFNAAYLRGTDAVKLQPDDPSAHFVLAEAAMKLNKRDEAIAQYQQCLKLDPLDKEAKSARKALEKLQAQR